MPYRLDPRRRARQKIHEALNLGHRFALVTAAGQIVEAKREKRGLEFTHRFRPDLVLMDLNEMLTNALKEGKAK